MMTPAKMKDFEEEVKRQCEDMELYPSFKWSGEGPHPDLCEVYVRSGSLATSYSVSALVITHIFSIKFLVKRLIIEVTRSLGEHRERNDQ